MERLNEQFRRLIDHTDTIHLRYLHNKVDWKNRLIAIVGARGVGKTTLMLQHIKLFHPDRDVLYVSADDLYFSENSLFDLASEFYKLGGKHLFIDEIHKYPEWSKEVKMMYDYFHDLQVVFTGSSILDVYKGSDDLSRRVIRYYMQGLSFREYLNISLGKQIQVYALEDIISNHVILPGIEHPLPHFMRYLKEGYYPFYKEPGYDERLKNVINLTLESDIPIFLKMNIATSQKLKQLLYIVAQSVPFKPNLTKIAALIGIHRNQVADFLYYLERAGIIAQLRNDVNGIRLLGKVEKIYLENSNLAFAIGNNRPDVGNIRETFFFNQMQLNHDVLCSDVADFKIGEYTFEVGGKNKSRKQIINLEKAYVAKDGIEYGYQNTIPLWAFGFNY